MARNTSAANDQRLWYKDAIIYELHIKAFRDSNRDGIGDFQGLLEKLDYLQELGVTAIWVLPFYPSPLKDDGYDIADYYTINPRYGTLDQFRQFLDEAHKRNLKVITELVINHTSDQHPWFQRARMAPRDSDERNFYVWTDDPNQYKDVRIIFQDFEASNWTWDPVAQQYYWHRFFHHQPDLNYDNPLVQQEIFKIIDYWCEMGVDGFRLDAVPYLYEREGTNGENLPETHAFLKRLRKHIDTKYPNTLFLAEANMWPEDSASYFGNGDECHMNYHFPVMPRMFMSLQREDRYPITDIFDQTPEIPQNCQWAIFLRNHDELTLEMVTDEERDFMYKVYAKDPKARINLGIRHRLAPLMDNDRRRIEVMNSLLFSLPGTPVIYYGDEIGMGDNFYLGDRDGVRTPMQWSPDRNAGFSEANPQQLYLPVILDPEYNYEAVNVEMQRRNTSSLFWFMKRIINMRKSHKAFSRGDMKFLAVENSKILAFTRTYEEETILVIVNLSKYAQPAEVDLRSLGGCIPVEMFSKNSFPTVREDRFYFFTLGPHSFTWFLLQKKFENKEDHATRRHLQAGTWDDLFKGDTYTELENDILPAYLEGKKWFQPEGRPIYSIAIETSVDLNFLKNKVRLLIVGVSYGTGFPETYQLACIFIREEDARRIITEHPEAVLANATIDGEPGILCDAFYTEEFQQFLLSSLAKSDTLNCNKDQLVFAAKKPVQDFIQANRDITVKMHTGDERNTAITYNNTFFLKMYRKIEPGVNPDVELSQFLAEEAGFGEVPRFYGTITWKGSKGSFVLGILQQLIENHGSGHSFMLERINNFIERILARDRSTLDPFDRKGSLLHPVAFEELPESLQVLLGNRAAEQARLLGSRTGELHLALSSNVPRPELKPEDFSLHYQRSLYSSMQSKVREVFDNLHRTLNELPEEVKSELASIAYKRQHILDYLKRIYSKKFDAMKIRHHGTYELKKILVTGNDLVIQDFSGKPSRTFSERRIKRSPLRDVAEMVCSFYYVAFEGFGNNNQSAKGDKECLLPFAEQWAHYMSSFFCKAYFQAIAGTAILPADPADLDILLQSFLLERAVQHLNEDLMTDMNRAIVPARLIKSIIEA